MRASDRSKPAAHKPGRDPLARSAKGSLKSTVTSKETQLDEGHAPAARSQASLTGGTLSLNFYLTPAAEGALVRAASPKAHL